MEGDNELDILINDKKVWLSKGSDIIADGKCA